MSVEMQLIDETKKWTARIKERRKRIKLAKRDKKDFMDNIDAYISDSAHFMKKGDLVRSFEAVVWAWAWLEIGLNEGILKEIRKASG